MDKDFSLLRPFDLETAKAGEPICTRDGQAARFVAHVPECSEGRRVIAHLAGRENCAMYFEDGKWSDAARNDIDLCMAPLAWVEGKPVYVGARLYFKSRPTEVAVDGRMTDGSLRCDNVAQGIPPDALTWTPYAGHAGAAPLLLAEEEARRVYALLWVARQMDVVLRVLHLGGCEVRGSHSDAVETVRRDMGSAGPVERFQSLNAFARAYGLPAGRDD